MPEKVVDRFSWKDVRTLAQKILEDCDQDEGEDGVGGIAPIGLNIGWVVSVLGVPYGPQRGLGVGVG